ncbi:MAG: YbaB/EbfC family nucleoid-associated protein [Sphingomonadales bacterium]
MKIGELLKQAQGMQSKMAEMQAKLDETEIEGRAGGGLVSVTLSGKGDLRRLAVDPSLLDRDETEVLEDLIVAAHADAKSKIEAMVGEKMGEMTGGLPLPPGLKLPF